jgi:hypothetical protein
MEEILPGVHHWTARHPRIGVEVSSHWLAQDGVAIDPLLPPGGVEALPGPTTAVLLSNRHHYRHAGEFDVPVHASRPGMHEFSPEQDVQPFDFGDRLPGGVVAVELGGICADDTALYLPEQRAVLFADGLVDGRAHSSGAGIGWVPDALMDDPAETKAALLDGYRRILDELDFDHVLMAHGLPLIGDGREQLQALVDAGGRTAFSV